MAGLGFIFILLPFSIIMFLFWIITGKKEYGVFLLKVWGGLALLISLSFILKPLWTKKELEKSDFYGEYIIDRSYFPGKQADWQYNSFRFEIKENDSIYFYRTEGPTIIQTFKGKISTITPFNSARLKIEIEKPVHHILTTNPTIYREIWGFFLVFKSKKFHNMYFRKGNWKVMK